MKQQLIMILPAFLFQLVFSTCGSRKVDCPGAENNYINLTADELSKVPYTGTDTLYFLDQNNDTHIVVGQGRQYYYDSEPIFFHPECPNDRFNHHQAYKIEFIPIKGNMTFTFRQQKRPGYIILSKTNYQADLITEHASVGLVNTVNSDYYIDSLVIEGFKYGRINKCVSRLHNSYQEDTTYTAYYNKSHGLLFLKSEKDQEAYSILNR